MAIFNLFSRISRHRDFILKRREYVSIILNYFFIIKSYRNVHFCLKKKVQYRTSIKSLVYLLTGTVKCFRALQQSISLTEGVRECSK